MDLKSYANTEPYAKYRDEEILSEKKKVETDKKNDEADVKRAINHFSKMSQDQLMVELGKHIGSQKDKGNAGQMKETIGRILPMLNAEQKQRMSAILKQFDLE